jgi:hypothetical protein
MDDGVERGGRLLESAEHHRQVAAAHLRFDQRRKLRKPLEEPLVVAMQKHRGEPFVSLSIVGERPPFRAANEPVR